MNVRYAGAIAALSLSVPALAQARCDDECMKVLQDEIRVLDGEVASLAEELLRPNQDLAIWLHHSVLQHVLARINETDRKFHFHSISVLGNFAAHMTNCGIFGDCGWVLGPDGGGAADAYLGLQPFQFDWKPTHGLTIAAFATLTAKLSLHIHCDLGWGGGLGLPGGAFGGTADTLRGVIDLANEGEGFVLRVKGEQPPTLGVAVNIVSPSPCSVLPGTMVFPVKSSLRKTLAALNLASLLKLDGVIAVPQLDGTQLDKQYRLASQAIGGTIDDLGYDTTLSLTVTFP